MALKIIELNTKEYEQMLALRNDVLRKPLGLLLDEEELKEDKESVLIGAFEEEKILGCCMLVRQSAQQVVLRQMAVLHDLQGKGIGRALMQFAEHLAQDMGYRKLSMQARKIAQGFYEKMGYRVQGDEFVKLSIPHIIMVKSL